MPMITVSRSYMRGSEDGYTARVKRKRVQWDEGLSNTESAAQPESFRHNTFTISTIWYSVWDVFTNWFSGLKNALIKYSEPTEDKIRRAKGIVWNVKENCSESPYWDDKIFSTNLIELKKIFHQLEDLSPEKALQARKEIGKELVESRLVPWLCHIVEEYFKTTGTAYEFEHFSLALLILFNFSDSTPEISQHAATRPELFKLIAEQLKINYNKLENGTEFSKRDDQITRYLLGFTNNCSSDSEARKRQREEGYTAVLVPYLNKKDYKMSAILALANIVNEEESALLNTGVDAVTYLLYALAMALLRKHRRYMGWSTKELAHGVAQLAVNDFNKVMLAAKGALTLLLKLSFENCKEDQREAVYALSTLSFDNKNKDLMLQEPGFLDRIKHLGDSPDPFVNTHAQRILWNLRNKLNLHRETETPCTDKKDGTKSPNWAGVHEGHSEQHVMISYQWGSQPVILKIRDHLESSGYNTWVDVDRMTGSTLEAMAHAVEGSSVILMCVSQRYKDSQNCRLEAEYAHQRHVPVIPLMMEEGYKPDGWLGILLGSKLYFDFSGKYKFGTKLEEMLKELESTLQQKQPCEKAVTVDVVDVGRGRKRKHDLTSSEDVSQWKKKKVAEWIRKKRIRKPGLTQLTGKHLVFLMKVRTEAPERFYSLLESNLGRTSMDDMMDFVEALNDLQ